ncbi:MAG: hypothetical protein ABSG76_15250 [Xanthobacteraceae bacterium]
MIDRFDDRAYSYNRSAAQYANMAEFLNIIRASQFEPLNFVTFSSAQSHNTLTGNLGLPSVTVGPGQAGPQKDYVFGPNSATQAVGSDVTIANVDDPGSYAALMTPINPAVIGFFIEQGYPRELLFFLFVDHVETSGLGGGTVSYAFNNPLDRDSYVRFGGILAEMIEAGLTAQIDATAIPSADKIPAHKFCVDPALPRPQFGGRVHFVAGPDCRAVPWRAAAQLKPHASYAFVNSTSRLNVRIFLRSTYAVYMYLGRILRSGRPIDNLVRSADSDDERLFTVTHDVDDCFVQTFYEGTSYCVPNSANNTKRVFSLLRQLVGIKITPANPAPVINARVVQ